MAKHRQNDRIVSNSNSVFCFLPVLFLLKYFINKCPLSEDSNVGIPNLPTTTVSPVDPWDIDAAPTKIVEYPQV